MGAINLPNLLNLEPDPRIAERNRALARQSLTERVSSIFRPILESNPDEALRSVLEGVFREAEGLPNFPVGPEAKLASKAPALSDEISKLGPAALGLVPSLGNLDKFFKGVAKHFVRSRVAEDIHLSGWRPSLAYATADAFLRERLPNYANMIKRKIANEASEYAQNPYAIMRHIIPDAVATGLETREFPAWGGQGSVSPNYIEVNPKSIFYENVPKMANFLTHELLHENQYRKRPEHLKKYISDKSRGYAAYRAQPAEREAFRAGDVGERMLLDYLSLIKKANPEKRLQNEQVLDMITDALISTYQLSGGKSTDPNIGFRRFGLMSELP